MNKSKLALAVTGGATLVASLAAGFFLLQAFNAKTVALDGDMEEGIDGLAAVMQKATSLSRKPVYPCEKSVKEYEAKRDKFNEWRADALTVASRGDRTYNKTSSAAFKEFIFEESKRLSSLPGSANGALMKPDFPFGPFREFILDGKLPPESRLSILQRQWDDITFLIETLAKAGVLEITALESKAAQKISAEKASAAPKKRSAKKMRTQRKKEQAEESTEAEVSAERYAFTFLAKPDAFVRVLDEFNVSERFVTVESFSFLKSSDFLIDAISYSKKDAAEASSRGRSSSRRSSRRRAGKEEEEKTSTLSPREQALKVGVVSDPAYEAPLTVSITLTIRDFGSLGENAQESVQEEK